MDIVAPSDDASGGNAAAEWWAVITGVVSQSLLGV